MNEGLGELRVSQTLFYRKLLCVFIFFACTNHKYLLETLDICIICIIIINTNEP